MTTTRVFLKGKGDLITFLLNVCCLDVFGDTFGLENNTSFPLVLLLKMGQLGLWLASVTPLILLFAMDVCFLCLNYAWIWKLLNMINLPSISSTRRGKIKDNRLCSKYIRNIIHWTLVISSREVWWFFVDSISMVITYTLK